MSIILMFESGYGYINYLQCERPYIYCFNFFITNHFLIYFVIYAIQFLRITDIFLRERLFFQYHFI